ncbi:MAG: hypothetical protein AAF944_19610 [Bacteroidota bacterium]
MPNTSWLLLRNTPEDVVATPFLKNIDCKELLAHVPRATDRPTYTIWLTRIEQIHQFVSRIPNLAWELMDYATEPLSLVYSHTKPLFPEEVTPPEVCIRLVNEHSLLRVLSPKYAWLTVALDRLPSGACISDRIGKDIRIKNSAWSRRSIKIMRVHDNGEFSFIP